MSRLTEQLDMAGNGATLRGREQPRSFHTMVKPIGATCNLSCTYCFYSDKGKYFPESTSFRMDEGLLEAFVHQYIASQQVPEVTFAWQGGEPTLLGVNFFRRAIELQRKWLPEGMRLINTLQTNGTLLDDEWCAFLKENDFLVGLSLDGPEGLHDRYRRDRQGRLTFQPVMRGLELLKKHGVEHNVLCVVHRHNSRHPLDVYRFFKEREVKFIQFIPLVERLSPLGAPCVARATVGKDVSGATVLPDDYGRFLCAVYDEWVKFDVGRIYVQIFESAFSSLLGKGAGLCLFEPTCGRAMALEHNGDVYSCDHFVFPEYRLGNILDESLSEIAQNPFQLNFGADKRKTLPSACLRCPVLSLCNGECPKNRLLLTSDGEGGLNYLCAGLRTFFTHALPTLDWMAQAYNSGRPPAQIMQRLQSPGGAGGSPPPAPKTAGRKPVGRNSPCPCGSGNKYKRCCGI